jgi:hypothetical protein
MEAAGWTAETVAREDVSGVERQLRLIARGSSCFHELQLLSAMLRSERWRSRPLAQIGNQVDSHRG